MRAVTTQTNPGAYAIGAEGAMRKLVLSMFVSLDGVADLPEKWQGPFWNDETAAAATDMLWDVDSLLVGRRTYEALADADDERLRSMPKFVVSDTLEEVDDDATLVVGDLADEVTELKSQDGNDILVHGSVHLTRSLMAEDLIDEYRIWVHPVVVGNGGRLFEPGLDHTDLHLVDTRIFSTGVVLLTYQPGNA